ncbi:hypothetical protein ACFQWB_06205 [Paenibacillus thermoaerophilus]|uniref:Uncharacterized protein n=1 Tax=Paenibacillus thermoaerophilus TaxID=1215385 RepID=A0ABW2V2S9_9BACL|nr:hypothetical protein [Paenibacillus thermoaerophilus]TMV18204.1 hypothetical protein FE781_04450 [Paenibacillus thermoaerophilus]
MERLLVKHIVGRLLLDTAASGCPFRLEEDAGRWTVTVSGVPETALREIERCRDELNLFHFVPGPDGETIRKYWLYDTGSPGWSAEGDCLKLTVDSRVPYSNDKV